MFLKASSPNAGTSPNVGASPMAGTSPNAGASPATAPAEAEAKRSGVRERAAVVLGTFFGAGYFPAGPGTLASAITVGLYLLAWPAALSPLWLLAVATALYLPAVWSAGACAGYFGTRDPGRVVIDEVLGQAVALAALPRPAGWKYCLAGFILFRIFDIVKPFPIGRSERLAGGWGIVTDDCFAGLYAFVALRAAVWWGA